MSDKTINELVELTDVSQTDELIIYDSSETEGNPTKKVTVDKLIYKHYSTDEFFTGKYWIDGKKIYGKVFSGSATNGTSVQLNISNLNKVLKIDGVIWYGNNHTLQLNNPNDSGYWSRVNVNNGSTIDFIIYGFGTVNYEIILEYTKTTD